MGGYQNKRKPHKLHTGHDMIWQFPNHRKGIPIQYLGSLSKSQLETNSILGVFKEKLGKATPHDIITVSFWVINIVATPIGIH
jgi:hypothetical protein